ncbi:protein YABBY 5 isoform X2 [Setaria viridis]|uniref:Uncharacterized protein n=1 Tax=Setaria viridis TaxID=4556 RepID=A0A4U6U609_SETVI|nr:protein YABBY 5-like isoform X2 [Setaria viridis]TKW05657.1 hypothetical protein SEVIR_7G191100v2 [Setaria viridis]
MMSSVPEAAFAMDQHLAPPQLQTAAEQEQLCYVHCKCCDTILAVGVPCSSLFKTVTVRCGHCANLLSVNLRGLLLPTAAANNQLPFGGQQQALLSPTSPHGLLDEMMPFQQAPSLTSAEPASACVSTITSINNSCGGRNNASAMSMAPPPLKPAPQEPQLPKSAASGNRTAEKRQRVPSAYNRFIKDEIQRIKASNPDITHREAFSAAAKNEGGECMLFKDGLYAAAAAAASSMGIAPF